VYLKSLEMSGFKSFADKTKLEFEPGLTAIVGPNGCGKSNIADAVRWVLGEQSPKAMRGSSMEDCIFSGTDARKPMGMAEVSLTLAECEESLGLEYNEVTVTRRVFRSGEGQYFINKAPTRLRDIQRLFMGTGVGTTSYSLMEQGKIDRILSARPEDRRAVFEEASGITKYKADKKEAIRKLEHTEANLLRLSDVIREVKRQIGSLQRQAGKARRYKEYREELRKLDLFLTRQKLRQADAVIRTLSDRIATLAAQAGESEHEVADLEQAVANLRNSLTDTDREISAVHESQVQANGQIDHTKEVVEMNRRRVAEYQVWTERDTREIAEMKRQLAEKESALKDLTSRVSSVRSDYAAAESAMKAASDLHTHHVQKMDENRALIQKLREESVGLESLVTRLQNQLMEIENSERASIIRRERLAAEKSQLARLAASFGHRKAEMEKDLDQMGSTALAAETAMRQISNTQEQTRDTIRSLQESLAGAGARVSAAKAEISLLEQRRDTADAFPGGARALLDPGNPLQTEPGWIVGALASALDVEPEYRVALEASMRAWGDAVLVKDSDAAMAILRRLSERSSGPARLVACVTDRKTPAAETAADSLLNHVRCDGESGNAAREILSGFRVAASIGDIPKTIEKGTTWVTLDGVVVGHGGRFEYWSAETPTATPLTTKHALDSAASELAAAEKETAECRSLMAGAEQRLREIAAELSAAGVRVEEARRTLAQKQGEHRALCREAQETGSKLETVTFEFDTLSEETKGGTEERRAVSARIEENVARRLSIASDLRAHTDEQHRLETTHSQIQSELVEHRVLWNGLKHSLESLETQEQSARSRIGELTVACAAREEGVGVYRQGVADLEKANEDAEARLKKYSADVARHAALAEELSGRRGKLAAELGGKESSLTERRRFLDGLRSTKSELDVQIAEHRMRRQNHLDRIASEYGATLDQVADADEPEWQGERPSIETVDTMIAELRTKIEAMGPVNLVAIEEYRELEERHAFLTHQETDLVNAKQQLMEMIRQINKTTSEMFGATFVKINEDFQEMFRRLFNGGSAKLVLVNEEDILECGIEIIARPPGKKLQNISLLSGGERTLTAVALLFAIYMIRPSPFCLLDELDAPLDDSNIGRFIDVLQDFLRQSQFVIITHNHHTISAADILYGVTMPDKGISKIVSMRFKRQQEQAPAQPEPQPVQ
jgi:chromosome segregation protein